MLKKIIWQIRLTKEENEFYWHQKALHTLAQRTRQDLLSIFQSLLPILLFYGDKNTIEEVSAAVNDVAEWWP